MTTRICLIVAALLVSAGCQSKLGVFYGAATGKTDASDLAPASRLQRNRAITAAPAHTDGESLAVSQASFAPPPLAGSSTAPAPAANTASVTVRRDPLPEPTHDEALAMVLGDLQQIGAENPAAQQELMRQLQDAQPGHWPLIVKRFRSTLALHEQLVQADSRGREEPSDTSRTMTASHHRWPQDQSNTRTSVGAVEGYLPPHEPPSSANSETAPYPQSRPDQSMTPPSKVWAPGQRVDGAVQQASATAPLDKPEKQAKPLVINMPTRDWRQALDETIELLEAETPTDPHTTGEAYHHARLRLLALAADDLDRAVAAIPGLSATEQDYWSKQLFALSTMLDASGQPDLHRRAAAAGLHLASAHEKLQQLGSLAVRNLTFCDEVFAFGAYKERQSHKFTAGEEVTLYVEVENFRTEETQEGHHTVIGSSYRVLDDRGNRVDSREFPAVDDYCLSRRRDFHIQYGIALPDRVYPGKYQLELTLTDQLGNKIGKAAVDFEIVEMAK